MPIDTERDEVLRQSNATLTPCAQCRPSGIRPAIAHTRLFDVGSEGLLRAVLEFDPVEMTIGVANVFARVCNRVAPLNVTLLRAVSGG